MPQRWLPLQRPHFDIILGSTGHSFAFPEAQLSKVSAGRFLLLSCRRVPQDHNIRGHPWDRFPLTATPSSHRICHRSSISHTTAPRRHVHTPSLSDEEDPRRWQSALCLPVRNLPGEDAPAYTVPSRARVFQESNLANTGISTIGQRTHTSPPVSESDSCNGLNRQDMPSASLPPTVPFPTLPRAPASICRAYLPSRTDQQIPDLAGDHGPGHGRLKVGRDETAHLSAW